MTKRRHRDVKGGRADGLEGISGRTGEFANSFNRSNLALMMRNEINLEHIRWEIVRRRDVNFACTK